MMINAKVQGKDYEYKSYTRFVIQPKKEQVTASALYYLREFIGKMTKTEVKLPEVSDWRLTKRQNQVMYLLNQGLSYEEVGNRLGIKQSTIKTLMQAIFENYSVNNKLNAVLTWQKNVKGE